MARSAGAGAKGKWQVRERAGVVYKSEGRCEYRGWMMDGVGGWWEDGGGLASPALCKRVVCMACPSFSAPPRRLKSRSRCQGGYTQLEVGKPGTSPAAIGLARGGEKTGRPTTMPGASCDGPLSGLQRGWVRNADANIEGETTIASTNEQRRAEETKGKQESSKQLAQNMRFRIAMPTSCLLALQGSSTLLPGLGLLPSAGRHASCLSLFSLTWSLGEQGSCRGRQRANSFLVWSLSRGPWGPGHGDLFRCGGWRYSHIHTQ